MTNKHLFLLLLAAFFAPLAMNAQSTLTVHDGIDTTDRVPIYSWHANVDQQSQLIYPASELTAMSGKALTQMVFIGYKANIPVMTIVSAPGPSR